MEKEEHNKTCDTSNTIFREERHIIILVHIKCTLISRKVNL